MKGEGRRFIAGRKADRIVALSRMRFTNQRVGRQPSPPRPQTAHAYDSLLRPCIFPISTTAYGAFRSRCVGAGLLYMKDCMPFGGRGKWGWLNPERNDEHPDCVRNMSCLQRIRSTCIQHKSVSGQLNLSPLLLEKLRPLLKRTSRLTESDRHCASARTIPCHSPLSPPTLVSQSSHSVSEQRPHDGLVASTPIQQRTPPERTSRRGSSAGRRTGGNMCFTQD